MNFHSCLVAWLLDRWPQMHLVSVVAMVALVATYPTLVATDATLVTTDATLAVTNATKANWFGLVHHTHLWCTLGSCSPLWLLP